MFVYLLPLLALWLLYYVFLNAFFGIELLCLGCGPTYKSLYPFPLYKETINPLGGYTAYYPGIVLNLLYHSFLYFLYIKFVIKKKYSIYYVLQGTLLLVFANIITWILVASGIGKFGEKINPF